MMTPRYLRAAGAIALSWALPCALSAQPVQAPAPQQDTMFFVGSGAAVMPFGGQVDVIGGEGSVLGGVVKDKPYSASSVTESTQILSDGNRIVNRNEAKIYRDSQGRTRREQTLGGFGVWQTANEPLTMVTINDPVADLSYFIDPARKTVRKLQPFRLAVDENAAWTLAVPAPPMASGPGGATAGRRVIMENGVVTTDVVVGGTVDSDGAETPVPFELPLPPPGPGVAMRGVAGARVGVRAGTPGFSASGFGFPGGQTATDDLGEQVLEGVLAHGTRLTQTIPAGTIGNERAIEIVAEQWYSADIEAVVLRRNIDPRFGETTYRLVNLVRGESAPDLFAVPQGYEMLTEPAFPPPHVELRSFGPGAAQGANVEPPPGGPAPPAGGRAERRVFLVQPAPAEAPQ
jgi:hypothetical protein